MNGPMGKPEIRIAIDVARVVRLEPDQGDDAALELAAPVGGRIVVYVITEDAAGVAGAPIVAYTVGDPGEPDPRLRIEALRS